MELYFPQNGHWLMRKLWTKIFEKSMRLSARGEGNTEEPNSNRLSNDQ